MTPKAEEIDQAMEDFLSNEDTDEGNKNLRSVVDTLDKLRYANASAIQKFERADVQEIIEAIISL